MTEYRTTCAITGASENLTMHAIRNDQGKMIGWIFLTEDISKNIDSYKIEIKTEYSVKSEIHPNK